MAQATTDERDQHVAAEVRAELGRQELSIAAFARQLQITEHHLRRRLKGQVPFSVGELEQVAIALGVPVNQFHREPELALALRTARPTDDAA